MARVGIPPTGRTSHGGARVALGALALALTLGAAGCAGTVTAQDQAVLEQGSVAVAEPAEPTPAAEQKAAPGTPPLVTATPDAHSEVGDLVPGFPEDLLPVPPDAVVLVTSAVPVGDADVQEVSLNLRTAATADDLLRLYRDALTTAGFTEVPSAEVPTDLAAEATFTRSGGDELVSVGILETDGARTVTIGGRVRTDG